LSGRSSHRSTSSPSFFIDSATPASSTLSLHDALPIYLRAALPPRLRDGLEHLSEARQAVPRLGRVVRAAVEGLAVRRHEDGHGRSEEHTSELQSPCKLVCRLLLEKKK